MRQVAAWCVVDSPGRMGSVPAWVDVLEPPLLRLGPPFKSEDVILV